MINLPKNVQEIIKTLESAGFEAFIVGGCVRDSIRGVTPKDWDITTSAKPEEVKTLFQRTINTGIKHGTITVLLEKEHYEVTTYRIDGEYLDNRRPSSVSFGNNIIEDLSRRDFTMNAIAYSQNRGFIDPFFGCKDIKNGIIRCVGDPIKRFNEDALRMIRAIRFAGVLGFNVDDDVLVAIKRLKKNLLNISAERIREELGKLLLSNFSEAFFLLENTELLTFVLLGYKFEGDLKEIVDQIKRCPVDEPMRLALFLQKIGTDKLLQKLRFDNKTIKETMLYIQKLQSSLPQNRYEIKKMLNVLGLELFAKLMKLKQIVRTDENIFNEINKIRAEATDIVEKNECFSLRQLAVNGDDLKKVGVTGGKLIGDILARLLDDVMKDPSLNNSELVLRIMNF